MRRSNSSRWLDADEDGGERTSGVRARVAPPPPDRGPCASLEEVYRRYQPPVWSKVRRALPHDPSAAEDVVQQVFLRLNRRILRLRGVPHPIGPLLLGFVDDEIKNHARAERRRRNDGPPDSKVRAPEPDPEQLLHDAARSAQRRDEVQSVFSRMREADVSLLELVYVSGLVLAEIAADLGVREATLRVRLHRARARFAELYLLDHSPGSRP
jgi:RNA polymerase sigma factor (sigma-70 family)